MPEQAKAKTEQPGREHPSLLAMLSFLVRSKGLQARHVLATAFVPRPLMMRGEVTDFPYILAESVTALDSGVDLRERPLLLGKIQNLRLACRALHHRVLVAGETFSFWSQVGPPWSSRGFAVGREVREGCVIPTTGGGLCQLSGSLLEVASTLDFDVVERHRHTALPSDIPNNPQRDATLFWNYVDLRFRSDVPVLFEAYLSESELVIRIRGKSARKSGLESLREQGSALAVTANMPMHAQLESCHTCNQVVCVRHRAPEKHESQKTAFLVDEYQPEFDAYIRENI